MLGFIGRVICWNDAEITVVHMVSELTPNCWNLSANKEFQHNFYKQYSVIKLCSPNFISKYAVCLSNKVIHLHSFFYNCELSSYITETAQTTFTSSLLNSYILSVNYATKPEVNQVMKVLSLNSWLKKLPFLFENNFLKDIEKLTILATTAGIWTTHERLNIYC